MKLVVINKILRVCSFCVLFFTFQHCSKDTTINEPSELLNSHQDTVKVFISDGIYLEMKGLQDSYQLDESLDYKLELVNESDSNGFRINTEDGYINFTNFVWIYDADGNYVNGGTYGKLIDTLLMPSQSFEWEYDWNQSDINEYGTNQWTNDFATFGLKVYAGKYYIKAQHYGNDLLKNKTVTKWIEITEEGEALNGIALRYDNVSSDSLKVEFVIRNRTSQIQKCELNSTKTMDVYIGGGDPRQSWSGPPEFKETINLNLEGNTIEFGPKSDKLIYNYYITKNDTMYSDLEGDREFFFLIELDNRTIYARTHVYF